MKWMILLLLLVGAANARQYEYPNIGKTASYTSAVVLNSEWAHPFRTMYNRYQEGRIDLVDDHPHGWPIMWISDEPGGDPVGPYCIDSGSVTRIRWALRPTYERRCVLEMGNRDTYKPRVYYLNVRYEYRDTYRPTATFTRLGRFCGDEGDEGATCRFRINTVLERWQPQ